MALALALESHIRELSEKHNRLDVQIQNEVKSLASEDTQIKILKRKKLKLKEELEALKRKLN
jgi:hypothetical protein